MAERTTYPAGHVVHMSLDHRDRAQSISVALCDCGWEHRTAWLRGCHIEQQAAIEEHWQSVEHTNG